ncbi:phosphate signaling complex PhoU family protein [Pyrococcus yayanosii]|uniref:Transcription regulator, SpoVT/AbrB family, containing PhoU domain n=1 Tax=Pyrococcus yayanosii (strain CH1 / JCM 16557) TaxID=529709 RepID=F8AEE5_PYRYC|nr:phosphate uptake regulator PhoU [Pyrococcus yayanosii]AEH25344.1 Transcription regulator, SpoVT/AbrB family, containing PhoU domain [Pyrococcus yayanosii CH1]
MEFFRKIQFTGRSSYIVSLPKGWIQEHGLKKGDSVILVVNPDGSLTIFPRGQKLRKEKKTLEISKDFSPDMAIRLAISAYIQGYDVIELRFPPEIPEYRINVRKTLQSLPGLEIISEEPVRIIAKSLLDEKEISVEELLHRLSSILLAMFEDLELMKRSKNEELIRDINDLENELDRFYFLTLRAVNRLLSSRARLSPEEGIIRRNFDLLGVLFIVRNVERIGDHITRIAENFDEDVDVVYMKEKYDEMMIQIRERNLHKVDALMSELRERVGQIDYRKSIAMESYRRILEYIENIGETIINMAIS